MKLAVVHADGTRTVIDLELPLTVAESDAGALNVIMDAKGIDHYFDKAGFYDGWGAGLGPALRRETER
jgi:hypothetical protein